MLHVPEAHSWMHQITVTQPNLSLTGWRFILNDRNSTFKCSRVTNPRLALDWNKNFSVSVTSKKHSRKSTGLKCLKSHHCTHQQTAGCCCGPWRCRSPRNEPIRGNCHLLLFIDNVSTANQLHCACLFTGTKTIVQLGGSYAVCVLNCMSQLHLQLQLQLQNY